MVVDNSCRVSIKKGADDVMDVWLEPVSLFDVYKRSAGAFLKPKSFTLELSNCRMGQDDGFNRVRPAWVAGYVLHANTESTGYLVNTLKDGARNVYLALAVNENNTLSKDNIIIPGDPMQNRVNPMEVNKHLNKYTYYIGYVYQSPSQVTTGKIHTWATWRVEYD